MEVIRRLLAECAVAGIRPEIAAGSSTISSIWKKMQRKVSVSSRSIDMRAVRTGRHRSRVLRGVGNGPRLWRPVPGEFDNYIARPKGNGYRSAHSVNHGDDGKPLEVQVRTREMHEQRGVAAHCRGRKKIFRATEEKPSSAYPVDAALAGESLRRT